MVGQQQAVSSCIQTKVTVIKPVRCMPSNRGDKLTQAKREISFWKPSALFLIFFVGFVFYFWIASLAGTGVLIYYLLLVLLYILVRPWLAPKISIVLPLAIALLFALSPLYIRLYMENFPYFTLTIGGNQIQLNEWGFTYSKDLSKYIDLNPMTNTRSLWPDFIKGFVFFSGIMLIVHYLFTTIRTRADPFMQSEAKKHHDVWKRLAILGVFLTLGTLAVNILRHYVRTL